MLGKARDLSSLTKPVVFSEYFSCLCWAKIHDLEGEHTITQTDHLSFTTLARPLGKEFENEDTLWVSYSLYSLSPESKASYFPSRALEEEVLEGLTLCLQQDLLPLGWGVVFLSAWLEAHECGGSIPPRSVLFFARGFYPCFCWEKVKRACSTLSSK